MMLVLFFILFLVSATATHAQQPVAPSEPVQQQVCGRAMDISCVPALRVTLRTERDVWVSLNITDADADFVKAQQTLAGLQRRNVCAAGRLTKKGDLFDTAQFAVARVGDLTAMDGDHSPDWVPPDVVRSCDPDFVLPVATKQARPTYPEAAIGAGIQGAVWVGAIVDTDGRVREVKLLRSVDQISGVDEEALETAKKWRFRPVMKNGVPVRALVTIEISFTL